MTMNNNSKSPDNDVQNDCYLPDFCQGENILRLILVLELAAIVFSMVGYSQATGLYVDIALRSLYIQWVGLGSAGLLCLLRRKNWVDGEVVVTVVSFLVVAGMTLLCSLLALVLDDGLNLQLMQTDQPGYTLLRHVLISTILLGVALRYFFIQHRNRAMLRKEASARLQALQARIRPHFLFISLNTIASLTYDQPEQAERAIENLAELFRASLKAEASVTLAREIEFTREYIELESLRLGDRLRVDWHIDAQTNDLSLPALTLQPLVENAIYHGIEPAPAGGEVSIRVEQNDELLITISNPVLAANTARHRDGNQMALDNIRERLSLAFANSAKIEHIQENDLYTVEIRIPITS